jgi:hypothetical protein
MAKEPPGANRTDHGRVTGCSLGRGSEQYLELFSDVAVAAEIMSAKAEQVGQTIDQVMDTIPD